MSKKLTTKEFVIKAISIYGNKYKYDNTHYISSHEKIEFYCNICESMQIQKANNHIQRGCPTCGTLKGINKNTRSANQFILEARAKHNDKYDYSKSKYKKWNIPISIACTDCKTEFKQTPNLHLFTKHGGCPTCLKAYRRKLYASTKEEFIKRSRVIHHDKYDYSMVKYVNNHTNVDIRCIKHDIVFKQYPLSHINNKSGCPVCKSSHGEQRIKLWLKDNMIAHSTQTKFPDCRGDSKPLPFDFYIKKLNLCIEYDGIQHFKPIQHFGGIDAHNSTKTHDNIKNSYCAKNSIKLLRIPYWEFDNIPKILSEYIK